MFSAVQYLLFLTSQCSILVPIVSTSINSAFLQRIVKSQLSLADDTSGNQVLQARMKRGLLAEAVDINNCLYFCKDNSLTSSLPEAPTFSNCPPADLQPIYYADKGERSTTINWSPPTASDANGSAVKVTELSLPGNGDRFEGLTTGYQHRILYEAVNNDGLRAFCKFNVTVKVRTCPLPSWTDSGHVVCSKRNIYGSTCSLQCRDGYLLTGNSTFTCEEDDIWTGKPSCLKTKCPEPAPLLHGTVTCNNVNHLYQSVCSFTCKKGFALEGPIYSQCQSDQTWSHEGEQSCIDIEPPVLECLTPQIFYADKGLLSASVTWLEPSAHDNTDTHPNITRTEGPLQGDVIPTGRTLVTYRATDEAGNLSPTCFIELKVLEITCEHPGKTFKDANMRFNCSDAVLYYGVSCSLSCDYNLPLDGSATIACDKIVTSDVTSGFWRWESSNQPYCKDVACPILDPPANGGLIHDSVHGRPEVFMNCSENFAIPHLGSSFDGHLSCLQGSWKPFNRIPDCVAIQKPSHMSLPAELFFYYSTNCSETQLQQKILSVIYDLVNPSFKTICPDAITCSVTDVSVKCGQGGRRKKRDLTLASDESYQNFIRATRRIKREEPNIAVVEFDITTGWFADNMTTREALIFMDDLQVKQKKVLADLVSNGSCNVDGYTLRKDSFQTENLGNIRCGPGMILDRVQCEPCPRGMYLNGTSEECEFCPVGQYQDSEGNTTCKRCPQGYSTLFAGSRNAKDCKKLCQPGYASVSAMEPCTKCRIGSYQEYAGKAACMTCPRGRTTSLPGSKNQTECQSFDVLVHGTISDTVIGQITAVQNISVSFRVKLLKKETTKSTTIKLLDGKVLLMSITMSAILTVALKDSLETEVSLTTEKWIHVMVVASNTLAEIYISGRKNISNRVYLPSLISGSFVLSATKSEGILLSGFQVTNQILSEGDVTATFSSCTALVGNPVITMDDFLSFEQGNVSFVSPSSCDGIDDCSSSPCGDHVCVDEGDGFRCICSNHMTGRLCETPPDYCSINDCKHGNSCKSHSTNYTCACDVGYSGMFCDLKQENASWSDYGEWSSCSVTCDQGVRTRTRSCDPPTASQQCVGESVEIESCNTGPCTECKSLAQTNSTILNCTTDDKSDMLLCRLDCPQGTLSPPGFNQLLYTCGLDTNYHWAPFSRAQTCNALVRSEVLGLDITCGYSETIPASARDTFEDKIRDNFSEMPCSRTVGCAVTVSLDNAVGGVSMAKITMQVTLTSSVNLDIDGYMSTGTMNVALQEVVTTVVVLEQTAAAITGNPSDICDVTVDGYTYHFNRSSLLVSSVVDCPYGSVPSGGLCVTCPIGTRADSDSCVFCDVISYQDEQGQDVCKSCPRGFRTTVVGATTISECTVRQSHADSSSATTVTTLPVTYETTIVSETLSDFSSVEPPSSTSVPTATDSTASTGRIGHMTESPDLPVPVAKGQDDVSVFGIGGILGVVLGCLALLLSVFAVTIVLLRSRKQKRHNERDRGLSFDNDYVMGATSHSLNGPRDAISGDHNRVSEAYDELPPPYSYDTDPSLSAVTSFTSYNTSKDYTTDKNTDYLSPTPVMQRAAFKTVDGFNTMPLDGRGEIIDSKVDSTYLHPGSLASAAHTTGSECEGDSTYMHARSSNINENGEDTSGECYATIPLARVDSSISSPYEQMN